MTTYSTAPIKKFKIINYPGVIHSIKHAEDTLGGISQISKGLEGISRHLELNFTPSDLTSKVILSEKKQINGILVKISFKKKKGHYDDENLCRTCVLGVMRNEFNFNGFCDFQYLLGNKHLNGQFCCVQDDVFPISIKDYNWLSKEGSLFLPPYRFARIETLQPYLKKKEENIGKESTSAIVGRSRSRRMTYVKIFRAEDENVPQAPDPNYITYIGKNSRHNDKLMQSLTQMFEERPVWTKHALMQVSGLGNKTLKGILPMVAYYSSSGPFRITWIRFGYDPRKHFPSRYYQIIDYRVKGLSSIVENNKLKENKETNMTHVFNPHCIPVNKQMIFQFCDINIEEVRVLLDDILPTKEYEPKYGWLSEDILSATRKIMDKSIISIIKKEIGTFACEGSSNDVQILNESEDSSVEDDDNKLESDFDFNSEDEEIELNLSEL